MIFKFTIPGRLSGFNELKKADKIHWAVGAKLRKKELKICQKVIWIEMIRQNAWFSNAIAVSFAWVEPNAKRDLDNITAGQKAILDALVDCGIIPNDTRKWMRRLSHTFPDPDKRNPRIEVTVEDYFCGQPTSHSTETSS